MVRVSGWGVNKDARIAGTHQEHQGLLLIQALLDLAQRVQIDAVLEAREPHDRLRRQRNAQAHVARRCYALFKMRVRLALRACEDLRVGHADVGGRVHGLLRHEDGLDDHGVALVDAFERGELPADVVQAIDAVELGFFEHVLALHWRVSYGACECGEGGCIRVVLVVRRSGVRGARRGCRSCASRQIDRRTGGWQR